MEKHAKFTSVLGLLPAITFTPAHLFTSRSYDFLTKLPAAGGQTRDAAKTGSDLFSREGVC
jgi:hypothetical protein